MEDVRRISVSLQESNLSNSVRDILRIIRASWATDAVWPKLASTIFTDGITNKLIGYFLPEDPRDVIIFRIYGPKTEEIIDREAEIETMKFLHEKGMGSRVYGIFENGIAYEFVPGVTLTVSTCKDPQIWVLVAEEMARLHSIPIPEVPRWCKSGFWNKIATFVQLANKIFDTNPVLEMTYAEFGLTKEWISTNVKQLKNLTEAQGIPLTLCHNDVLLQNIVYDKQNSKISFIDYEYALVNYGAFDLANHFNEMAGVDNCDFTLCPDDEFKKEWIGVYLKYWKNPEGVEVDVDRMLEWVNLCIPLSHLMWIIWTIIQAQNSTIDFDYITYGKLRFFEFEKRMEPYRYDVPYSLVNGN